MHFSHLEEDECEIIRHPQKTRCSLNYVFTNAIVQLIARIYAYSKMLGNSSLKAL